VVDSGGSRGLEKYTNTSVTKKGDLTLHKLKRYLSILHSRKNDGYSDIEHDENIIR